DAVVGVYIYRDDGIGVFGTNTLIDGVTVPVKPEGIVRFAIQGIELLPGGFDVDIGITDPQDRAYDYHQKGVQFRVIGTSREVGVARLAHRWEFRCSDSLRWPPLSCSSRAASPPRASPRCRRRRRSRRIWPSSKTTTASPAWSWSRRTSCPSRQRRPAMRTEHAEHRTSGSRPSTWRRP